MTAVVHSTYAGTSSPRLTGLLRKPCRPSQGRQETRRHPMIPHHLQSHMALPQLLSELLLLHLVSSDIIQFAHVWLIFGHPLVFKTSVVSYTLCLWRNIFHLRHLFHVWKTVSLQWPPSSFILHVDNLCSLFYSWWIWLEGFSYCFVFLPWLGVCRILLLQPATESRPVVVKASNPDHQPAREPPKFFSKVLSYFVC